SAHLPSLPSFPTRRSSDLVDRQFGRQHGAEPDSHFFCTAPNTPPMMPHPSTGAVHLSSAMRPAESTVIVRNFNKGLMQVRSPIRSEEHTSELQSRFDLVCR